MEKSRKQLDKQDWCSKEIITMGVIYLNMHSTKKAMAVTRINEANMGKHTELGEKRTKERMLKDKNIETLYKGTGRKTRKNDQR